MLASFTSGSRESENQPLGNPLRFRPGGNRSRVEPSTWLPQDWNLAAASGVEAIEGFWVTRPWSSSATCPPASGHAAAIGTEPVTLPGQTLAMAQFFADAEEDRKSVV